MLFMIEDQKHIAFYDRRLALTTKMNFRRVAKWDGVFTHNWRVTFWNPTVALDQALGHNLFKIPYSAKIYLFQRSSSVFIVNLESTRKRCGLCSKLTIKTPERRLTASSSVSIVDFEQVNVSCAWPSDQIK